MQLYLRLAWRNIWRHRRRTVIIVLAMGLVPGHDDDVRRPDATASTRPSTATPSASWAATSRSTPRATASKHRQQPAAPHPERRRPSSQTALRASGCDLRRPAHPDRRAGQQSRGRLPGQHHRHRAADAEAPVSLIAENIADGRLPRSRRRRFRPDRARPGRRHGHRVGDRITLVGSDVHKQNRQRTMTVVGIYDIGMASMEKADGLHVPGRGAELYGLPDQSTEIDINLKQPGHRRSAVVPALVRRAARL